MIASPFSIWINQLRQQLVKQQQRCLVVLNGDLFWSNQLIVPLLKNGASNEVGNAVAFGAGFTANKDMIIGNYRHHLGTENDVVFFADENFHPDAFAALSGTIKAGGIMFWLCSPDLLQDKTNLFIQRFWQKIVADKQCIVVNQTDDKLPALTTFLPKQQVMSKRVFNHEECLTQEQVNAVAAIEKVAKGHRKRPLVLTADRGRGKSSALAIAVANLIKDPQQHAEMNIMITAPHSDAVSIFFAQLATSCPAGKRTGLSFHYNKHHIKFMAVDTLVQEQPTMHLLLVDEAAAIPIYLLSRLLNCYHRLVFSSTVHGYEGAGRGFAINFKKILINKTPNFSEYHIHQPIRWCDNDPLEQLIFNSFLLTPQSEQAHQVVNKAKVLTQRISQQALYQNEPLLQQVFNVLVSAHYQTSPSDLKFLLNNAKLTIFVSFADDKKTVVAVALALNESGANSNDIALAVASKKRLKSQFLPQSLLLHCGVKSAFDYRYLRVVRIAVKAHTQSEGIGSNLLRVIEKYAIEQHYHFVGTSFGANTTLVNFWGRAGYQFARLGFTKDKASGEHSCILLKALSASSEHLLTTINEQFYQRFYYYLAEQFQSLNPKLVQYIYQQATPQLLIKITPNDINTVEDFINKVSLYDVCAYSLSVWLCHILQVKTEKNAELLIEKILQRHSSAYLCQQYQLTGKKALTNAIITQVSQLYY